MYTHFCLPERSMEGPEARMDPKAKGKGWRKDTGCVFLARNDEKLTLYA